ncbi:hypothetical protein ACQEV9_07515 [Streptomyces chartreusis]|uniref:hypothetical protein n=1 Tax=Streptomyces chartreusis TaxID=1969 RepID=UPI003D8E004F
MTAAAVTLAVVAAVLEIWGIVWTILDIRAARRRLASYLVRPRAVYAHAGVAAATAMAVGLTPQNQTIEQRLESLEAWRHALPDELGRREQRSSDILRTDFQGALKATERGIDDQLKGLREYVEGAEQSVWASYRGPIVLGLGVALGLAGNIVSAL